MWGLGECCSGCNIKAGVVIDSVSRKISCSACGLGFGLVDCNLSIVTTEPNNASTEPNHGSNPVSIATTEPMNTSSDDFLPSDLGNSQNFASDPVSVATNEPNKDSSDDEIIAALSDRLGLLATVKNQAIEISEKIKVPGLRRKSRSAACVYIACRQNDMALSFNEISSVADEASASQIANAVRSIADKLGLECGPLIQIRAAEFVKRFCSTLKMDSKVAKAALEAAEASTEIVNSGRSPLSVAAVIIYVIARVSYEKKLLKDIIEATGVTEATIKETYKDLYPNLSTITPKWFANEKDLKKLDSP